MGKPLPPEKGDHVFSFENAELNEKRLTVILWHEPAAVGFLRLTKNFWHKI